ncbi:helix-turn-helix domain-containing protein [Streptomyces sp. NBC_00335]|uniref:helix-turn-helix domain-containing protein n=1 Tax=unclassified Streptomyces TaxID=2593676 RepID=UPI0022541152|nr:MULTISPECIES: helix-turn-helix domain-containing protein [unclassified Streptomyces]MCX5407527.1 helix-turn-helix domain-containing protein [Streptomyces sp. NBC_00086]
MKYDTSSLRKDTDEDDFPYADRTVTFVHVDGSGKVWSDHTKTGKIAILNDWRPDELLVATWTGARRSDTFSVNLKAARKALLGSAEPRRSTSQVRRRGLGPRQIQIIQQMHAELDTDGKRKYTAQQIADEFGVSRPTIYRHLEKEKS